MNSSRSRAAGLAVAILVAAVAWSASLGGCLAAKHEKTETVFAPLPTGAVVAVESRGPINVTGAETDQVTVVAKLQAWTSDGRQTEEFMTRCKVTLTLCEGLLTVNVEEPPGSPKVTADYTITVPHEASLKLLTHNGPLAVTGVTGAVDAETRNGNLDASWLGGPMRLRTSNGSVTAEDLLGPCDIETDNGKISVEYNYHSAPASCKVVTHNGAIVAHGLKGDLVAESGNGSIEVRYSTEAAPEPQISVLARNGKIDLLTPPNFSGVVDARTGLGAIDNGLPMANCTLVTRQRVQGATGADPCLGQLKLEGHNGSIKIR